MPPLNSECKVGTESQNHACVWAGGWGWELGVGTRDMYKCPLVGRLGRRGTNVVQKVSYAPMLEPKKWSMHRSCLLCTDRVSYAQIVSLMHRQYRNKASYAPTKMTVCPSSRYLCVYAPTFLVGYAPRNENLRKMVFQVHNNHKINL